MTGGDCSYLHSGWAVMHSNGSEGSGKLCFMLGLAQLLAQLPRGARGENKSGLQTAVTQAAVLHTHYHHLQGAGMVLPQQEVSLGWVDFGLTCCGHTCSPELISW